MPCVSGPSFEQSREESLQAKMPAVLCALLRIYPVEHVVWQSLDWANAGVTYREFVTWAAKHKREDDERLARLTRDREIWEIAERAKAKLTPEELAALKVK